MKQLIFCIVMISIFFTNAQQPEDLLERAKAEEKEGHVQEAEKLYTSVINQSPSNISAHYRLGLLFYCMQQFGKAISIWQRLIFEIETNNDVKAAIHTNLGRAYRELGNLEQALSHFSLALTYEPNLFITHKDISESYLCTGEFDQGWKHFDIFLASRYKQPVAHLQDLENKTIIIHAGKAIQVPVYSGYGDTFQWIRYAKLLKEQCKAIIYVKVEKDLHPLLKLCNYIDKLFTPEEEDPKADIIISHVHMNKLFFPSIDAIVGTVPYLYADKKLCDYWKDRLSHDHALKIGLCWSCAPYYYAHVNVPIEQTRKIPLRLFYPLTTLKKVSFYSLQKGYGCEQIKMMPQDFNLHTFEDTIDTTHGKFMDTSAIMKNLDLIITVDTSIAHLAGALGVPVWLLLPKIADWRWFIDRNDSPWYPTVKIFRQEEAGNWQTVIDKVYQELHQLCPLKKGIYCN